MDFQELASHYLFLLPLFISVLGVIRVVKFLGLNSHGIKTEALVTRKDNSGGANTKTESFSITYEFIIHEDEKITRTLHIDGSIYHKLTPPQKVMIMYDPQRPELSLLLQKIHAEFYSGIKLILAGIVIAGILYLV